VDRSRVSGLHARVWYSLPVHSDRRLNSLREHRVRPGVDHSIAGPIARLRATLERQVRDGDDVSAAWDRVVPEHLRGRAAVVGCKGGVLTIRCRSASDRYTLDRWLRGGGEQAVRDAARSMVKRVRLVLR
jgi:hypothetical protein